MLFSALHETDILLYIEKRHHPRDIIHIVCVTEYRKFCFEDKTIICRIINYCAFRIISLRFSVIASFFILFLYRCISSMAYI